LSLLQHELQVNQSLLRHEDIVVLEKIWHIELLGRLDSNILQVTRRKLKVVVGWRLTHQEAELVLFEWRDDSLKQLRLRVVQLLRVNKNELVFEQLRREHDSECEQPLLVVDREFEGARHGSMGLTTASSLRCTPVTLTGSTATFLWRWLLTRASDVATRLRSLPNELASMLEVLKYFVHDVSAQGLVKVFLI